MSDAQQSPPRFPEVSQTQWREELETTLGPGGFERKLVSKTYEGLTIQPLYSDHAEGLDGLAWREDQGWRAEVDLDAGGDRGPAREALRRDVRHGARGARLHDLQADDLPYFLEGLELRDLAVHFVGGDARALGAALLSYAGEVGVEARELRGGLGADSSAASAELLRWAAVELPGLTAVRISTATAAESGAGPSLQVALALSEGAERLREWTSAGLSLASCCRALEFELALGTDLFLELAKLRATRLAWGKLLAACGLQAEGQSMRLAARSSARAWTARDPWVNLLRGTTTTFAAAVGGADSFTLLPFDACLGESDAEARRLAANTQAILARESHLGAVEDAAAGCGYLEGLTEELARAAWARFRELEQAGGFSAASASGLVERLVSESASAEERAVRTRRLAQVGVSEFPSLSEELPGRAPRRQPLTAERLAAPFEALRARSDAHVERTGARPRAFLANLGSIPEHHARATFATNLLAAGGIEALTNDGFEQLDLVVEAFQDSGAQLCVIASSDARYAESVEALAPLLAAAGATVALAGRPGEHEAAWRSAGVQNFLHLGCDAVAALEALLAATGVSA